MRRCSGCWSENALLACSGAKFVCGPGELCLTDYTGTNVAQGWAYTVLSHSLTPRGKMLGKVQRAPGRKFGLPARFFGAADLDFYIIWLMKLPMVFPA